MTAAPPRSTPQDDSPAGACVDSSIAIAAFGAWHERHDHARVALRERPLLVAHAALETYSVLTRLPEPFRVDPAVAVRYLTATFPAELVTLGVAAQRHLPQVLERAGIRGGAVYDGLVALTAKGAGAKLLSIDARAARTYERLGADYRVLE